ncbi:Uncharacterised protein [Amycolatopsis camponoti]|uniref:Response regulatory domain-containing protein n=2 Tax=Amycolatopsis camponoti TaxID=2606593 RepID=A0A6I8LKQ6_9PSEU|nr:Uncharacterised protein [Amycolatopsis camponoti]
MGPIRVLITHMVALDCDIVRRIAGERTDMTIVGSVSGPEEAAEALFRPGFDVLLLSASRPDSLCGYLDLMWDNPRLGVAVVDPTDRLGVVRVCRIVERARGAGAGWPEYLAAVLRSAADPG